MGEGLCHTWPSIFYITAVDRFTQGLFSQSIHGAETGHFGLILEILTLSRGPTPHIQNHILADL